MTQMKYDTDDGCESMTTETPLCDDLLTGARAIGRHIGEDSRRTYYLLEHGLIPGFKLGSLWYARKSSLRRRFEELEEAATG